MSTTERFKKVNTIHTIVNMAEADIFAQTGLRYKLIVAPVADLRTKEIPEDMLQVIVSALGYTMADLHTDNKRVEYTDLRRLAAHFLMQYFPEKSTVQIAGYFSENVDHTVIGYYKRTNADHFKNEAFIEKYEIVLKALTQWQYLQELEQG